MNLYAQQHFTSETPMLLRAVAQRDAVFVRKVVSLLCNSSEMQMPQLSSTKMKLSELMDTMISKPRNVFQTCFEACVEQLLAGDQRLALDCVLEHLDDHQQCANALLLLFRLVQNSTFRRVLVDEGYYSELVEKFEIALQVPNSAFQKLTKLAHDGEFHLKLTKFLLTHYPLYSRETEQRGSIPEKCGSLIQVEPEQKPGKAFKIPPLKLPQANLEIAGVMTRSTRRADPFKSNSSNRFSHSIDSAIKFTSGALHVKTGEGNQSLEDVSIERKRVSAREELFDLANQLGSYCLTQDLSCLLLKQRRQQLDSLTRMGLNTIPTILKEAEEQPTDSVEQNDRSRLQKNRICRLWGNIVYIVAKDIRVLQYELSPASSILNYLCSNAFLKNNNWNKSLNQRKLSPEFDTEAIQLRNQLLIDSGDQKLQNKQTLEKSLHSEHSIYFMILDLYNSEKPHLKMQSDILRDNSVDNEESERSIESPHTVVNIPELMIPVRSVLEIKEIVCNFRHTRSKNLQYMNPFLKQFQMRFTFILSNFDMSKHAYYEQEADHLKVLDLYLTTSSSRIILPQFLDYLIDILLMIKRQIVDYSNCQSTNSTRTSNPSQYQSKSAKHYSQTITNMFKPITMFESPQEESRQMHYHSQQQPRPSSSNNTPLYYIQKQPSKTNYQSMGKQPFIQKYPNIVATYLSIIARLQLKAYTNESIKFLVSVYMNESFLDVVRSFTTFVFTELSQNKEESYELQAMKVIFFLESGILMLSQRTDKELKPLLRNYLSFLGSIVKSLQKYIEVHTYVLNTRSNLPRIQLYRKVFSLLGLYFSSSRPNEEVAVFMIRYCYVNFIKLYSQSNLNDLREINLKISEFNSQKIQPSSKQDEKQFKHWNIIFMNLFIKCLFQIASSRSEEISRKFYQYRIVEFLTREIDLEFDITQIKHRQHSEKSTPRSNNSSIISVEDCQERMSSKVSERQSQPVQNITLPPKINLNLLHKQPLEEIIEENEKGKKSVKMSQNLLKKVLVPKLDLEAKGLKPEPVISQSYSHSPQFNTSAKQLQNLTTLFKQSPVEQDNLNHKRGNSMPFKQELIQLSESQRMLLQKNLNTEKKLMPKLDLQSCSGGGGKEQSQTLDAGSKHMNEDLFYYSERKLRRIYADQDLHSNCLALLINLLIKPQRGTLDDLYCSQHPVINGKPNILFILHHHLNHPQNQKIIKLVLSRIAGIKSFPVGQRLLKLLCTSLFDISKYTEWTKIASGAYGVIFSCKTGLSDPEYVAIKQMLVPKNIYERCVLYGLFTELACMESFRLHPSIATVYDYGVTATDYVIVMKKYPMSLKEWRLQQKGTMQDNMATYLSLYRDVLQAVSLLHSHNITHYDIKADNILLDFNRNEIHVVLTDFGESRIFVNEDDEYCMRNRGTEYIKSPEMLMLTIDSKKEQDTYDRRKKVGTTRSSDVWSLGCLLYEIFTGELLFYKEWGEFYYQVTKPTERLITEQKQQNLQNNFYIIDFLKYVLVRDQKHRPNIESVLKRFEHVQALLVNNATPPPQNYSSILTLRSFDQLLEDFHKLVYYQDTKKQQAFQSQTGPLNHTLLKLTNEVFICDKSYFQAHQDKLLVFGVTHLISDTSIVRVSELAKFHYLLFSVENINQLPSYTKAAQLLPHLLDYLKFVLLHRGKMLLLENAPSYLRQALLLALSLFLRLPLFEAHHLFNNQLLLLNTPHIQQLNLLSTHALQLSSHLATYPRLQCLCASSTFVLKRDYHDEKRIPIAPCKCHGNQLCNGAAGLTKGCATYLKFLRKRYKLSWDSLKWGYVDLDAFLIGPFGRAAIRQESKVQLLLGSMGPAYNLTTQHTGDWKLYVCKVCHMWMLAHNKSTSEVALVMNNLQRKNKTQGLSGLKVPNLSQLSLAELK